MKNYCGIIYHSEYCNCINGDPVVIDTTKLSISDATYDLANALRQAAASFEDLGNNIEALKRNDNPRFYLKNGTGKIRSKRTNYTPKKKKRK